MNISEYHDNRWFFTYQGEGFLKVHVEHAPDGGVETRYIIQSLQSALEQAIRADEKWGVENPSAILVAAP